LKLRSIIPFLGHRNTAHDSLIEKAAREAESGRRLAMYDRQTGLFAHWYLQRRFEEEAHRAERYSTPLSAILIEVKNDDTFRTRDEVTAWLGHELRSTDLATHLGDGRFLAVLTETGVDVASAIAGRMTERFPKMLAIGLGSWPEDGLSLRDLQKTTQLRAHGNWALAV
jgi:GGDEF domain-containing protein